MHPEQSTPASSPDLTALQPLSPVAPLAPVRIQYLTVRDVAGDMQVTEYTIRSWAKRGLLQGAERIGRRWRFRAGVRYVPGETASATNGADALETLRNWKPGAR